MFNALNSNNENWFAKNRVISSPWTDLESNSQTYFSVPGASGRRLYISGPHNGCLSDYGWLSVTQHICPYERRLPVTSVMYSKVQTNTNWNVYGKQGRSLNFSKGGHTVSNIIVMAFSPRNIVGCLLKKSLTKGGGGHGHPRIPLATPLVREYSEISPNAYQSIVANSPQRPQVTQAHYLCHVQGLYE